MAAMPAIEERFESVFQMLVPINGLSAQRHQQLLARADILDFSRRESLFREGDRNEFSMKSSRLESKVRKKPDKGS